MKTKFMIASVLLIITAHNVSAQKKLPQKFIGYWMQEGIGCNEDKFSLTINEDNFSSGEFRNEKIQFDGEITEDGFKVLTTKASEYNKSPYTIEFWIENGILNVNKCPQIASEYEDCVFLHYNLCPNGKPKPVYTNNPK
jgi:hypothetical protein